MKEKFLLTFALLTCGFSLIGCPTKLAEPEHSNPLDLKHGPPKIVSVAPDSAAKDLPADTAIVVQFDDVMDIKTFTETTFKVQHTLDNQTLNLKGKFTFGQASGQNIASVARFAPDRFYLYNNTISVSLVGIKDVEGNDLMAVKNNWNFTTYPLTQPGQVKILFTGDGKRYPNQDTLFTSAGINANFKAFAYKTATDSLDITATVTWKVEGTNLQVIPGRTAKLITANEVFTLSNIKAQIGIKDQAGKEAVLEVKLLVDTNGPLPPVLKDPKPDTSTNVIRPTFKWSRVKNAVSYKFEIDTDANFTHPLVESATDLSDSSYILKNPLTNATTYFWRVQAKNARGNPSPLPQQPRKLKIDTEKPIPPPLSSPENGRITNVTAQNFTWFPISDAKFYIIKIDDNNSFSRPFVDSAKVSTLNYSKQLEGNGVYYWRVQSVDEATNVSGPSEVRSFEIDTIKPDSPLLTSPADGMSTNGIKPPFSWKDVVGAKSYRFQLSRSKTDFSISNLKIDQDNLMTPGYTPLNPITPNGTYFWRVLARDTANNESMWSDVWVVNIVPNLPPIAALKLSPTTSGKVPLEIDYTAIGSFDPDGSISSYQIFFGDGGTSQDPTGRHIYTTDLNYQFVLIVKDNFGLADTAKVPVRVSTPPIAALKVIPEAGGPIPLRLVVSGKDSRDPHPGGSITGYRITITNVTTNAQLVFPQDSVTTVLTSPANYLITLEVTNNRGLTSKAEKVIPAGLPGSFRPAQAADRRKADSTDSAIREH